MQYGESRTGSSSALVKADWNYSSALSRVTPSVCEQQKQELIWSTGTELQMCSSAEMLFSQTVSNFIPSQSTMC